MIIVTTETDTIEQTKLAYKSIQRGKSALIQEYLMRLTYI